MVSECDMELKSSCRLVMRAGATGLCKLEEFEAVQLLFNEPFVRAG
jgi:hypothetical protein